MQRSPSPDDLSSAGMFSHRLTANASARRDVDEWCLRQLPELPLTSRILDLGCGEGKQVHLFSPLFPASTSFYGMDRSAESLQLLRARYQAAPALHLIEGNFDDLGHFFERESASFDLIYSSHALYYSHDLPGVIRQVLRMLKRDGVFWVMAPYFGTHQELIEILRPIHEVDRFMGYVSDRFHAEVIEQCRLAGFHSIKPSLLRNTVSFADAAAFMVYLRKSLFYRPGHDEQIAKAVQVVVETAGEFRVSKNVISLQIRK